MHLPSLHPMARWAIKGKPTAKHMAASKARNLLAWTPWTIAITALRPSILQTKRSCLPLHQKNAQDILNKDATHHYFSPTKCIGQYNATCPSCRQM